MRRLGFAFAQLATSSLAGQAIGFAVLALVARRVGPANLGAYGFATSCVTYFLLPLSGLAVLAVREVAQHRDRARAASGSVVSVLILYLAVVCALVFVLAPFIAPN